MNKKLIQIARRYDQVCRKIYHRICTGVNKQGNRIPANSKEAARIKYEVEFELEWIKSVQSFEPNGFSRSEINKAVREYRRVR